MTATDLPDGRTLQEILDEAVGLRNDVKAAEAVRRVKEKLMIALLCGLVIVVLVMGAGVLKLFQVAGDSRQAAEQSARTAAAIKDCIVPTGHCYQDGNKRQSGAVGNLIKSQIAVVECSKTSATPADLEACVAVKLKPPVQP